MDPSITKLPKTQTLCAIVITISLILLTIVPSFYPFYENATDFPKRVNILHGSSLSPSSNDRISDRVQTELSLSGERAEKCDLYTREWVRNPEAPYYTNTTCWAIHEHQNCMKYGRPDTEFMRWRWKPHGCELPVFNPYQFLEIMRGKTMAFVGDSVTRNHMQSLICLLSRVEYPIDVSERKDEYFKRWRYTTYNFTIAAFWTTHLVRSKEADPNGPDSTGLFNLYLDEFDEKWTAHIEGFDYLIMSSGHWHFRPSVFYESGQIVGCHYCQLQNITDLTMYYGYRKAFRTAFRAILRLENFKGVMYLRTYAPSHFEGGIWNKGGNCLRTRPYRSNETALDGQHLELYMIQMEEFRAAEREARKKGLRFRLLDTTQPLLLRPDGHPSRYGHWPEENVTLYNDCVHWCLPGPIDTLSDFLLEMLKTEGRRRSVEDKRGHSSDRKMIF